MAHNANKQNVGESNKLRVIGVGPSTVEVFIPAGFIPPFPRTASGEELKMNLRPLTKAEQEMGYKNNIQTPWAWRAFSPKENAVWCSIAGARVFENETGEVGAIWASQILHIREQLTSEKPILWSEAREQEHRKTPPGWVCSNLRKQFREMRTQTLEMILGGDDMAAALVFEGETLIVADWFRKGKPFAYIVGEEIVQNVSRLRRGPTKNREGNRPPARKEDSVRFTGRSFDGALAPGSSLQAEGAIGPVAPVEESTKKVTVEESGKWSASGRVLPQPEVEEVTPEASESTEIIAVEKPKAKPKMGKFPSPAKPRVIAAAPRASAKPKLISAPQEAGEVKPKATRMSEEDWEQHLDSLRTVDVTVEA